VAARGSRSARASNCTSHRAAVRAARKADPALTLAPAAALGALAGKLARLGHEPRWDADLPGARRFYVDDPFDNRLEPLRPRALNRSCADRRVSRKPRPSGAPADESR